MCLTSTPFAPQTCLCLGQSLGVDFRLFCAVPTRSDEYRSRVFFHFQSIRGCVLQKMKHSPGRAWHGPVLPSIATQPNHPLCLAPNALWERVQPDVKAPLTT